MIRVYIADDHPVIRAGVREALSKATDIEIIGEGADGREVMESPGKENWDVLLLDLNMPNKNGWEILRRLRVRYPNMRILIISMHGEALYALQAMKVGAAGYITKGRDLDVYATAIRKVHGGENYVSEDLVSDLISLTSSNLSSEKEFYDVLSEREMQIFLMIAEGKRLIDIGEELNISVKTVSTHRRHILDKLKFKSNSDLVRYAIKCGLLV